MKNKEYWTKRMTLLEEAQHTKAAAYYENLEKQYLLATQNLEKEISTWYQRFAGNNGITMAEAKTLLNTDQLAEFKWTVQDYIKHGEANALDGKWMKELENASAKVHVTRLEALKTSLQQQAEVLYGNQTGSLTDFAEEVYRSGYYHNAFEIQKGINVGWDVQQLDDKRVEKVLSTPWAADGKDFSSRIWTNKSKLISSLQTNMTQTIMRGDSPDKMIKAMAAQLGVSRRQAENLVMTESAALSSAAQKDCFKDLDVEKYEIVATLDSHTSELCRDLDGTVVRTADYVIGETAPPFHCRCRTTTCPSFEDDIGGERAAKGADGKTYYVPSDIKYKDWKSTFVDGGTKTGMTPVVPEKTVAAFVPAKSMDELTQRFTEISGISNTNFGTMKPGLANQYLEGVTSFYQDHPKLKGFIDKFGTNTGKCDGEFRISGFRTVDNKLQAITSMGLKSPRNVDSWLLENQRQIDNGFFFNGQTPKTNAVHELTHAASYMIGMTEKGTCVDGRILQGLTGFLSDNCPDISYEVIKEAKIKVFGQQFGYETWGGMEYLGDYARSSDSEMLAQAIAYEYSGNSNIFSKTVKEIFETRCKGVLN